MIKIYHNPRCKKSRAGLKHLESKGFDFEIRNYIKEPPGLDELREILMKLNKKPFDIIRKQEEIYKKQFKDKNFTNNEWLQILSENPRLIQRPIVIKDYKAVLGDPPGNIDELF